MKMIMSIARHAATPSRGTPFLLLQPASILPPFRSYSASNHHPPSIFQNITNLDDALKLFDKMTQRQPLPSVVKFTQLLQLVTNMKHYSCSIDLFKQMATIHAPVNVYTTSIVIRCYCQMSCTTEGFAIVAYGYKRGVLPNVFTFNTLLNGLVLENRVGEAENLFKKLIKHKLCEPDVVTYNTMINGLCKVGIHHTAIALLRLMDNEGCKPDVMTYSTIIDGLCKDQMVDHALELFNVMIFSKGILPDVVTYSSLIMGLCRLERWADVSKLLREMEESRIYPNVVTCTTLVTALCTEGKLEDAAAVFNIMVKRGNKPDLVTYNSLIDGYCSYGQINKALEIFDSMRIRGIVPDIVTYNSLLKGYCKKLKIDEALHLFHGITEKGMKPNVVTYTTMLHGLFGVKRWEDAVELLKEMRAHNRIQPDACTYGIVLEGLCANGLVYKALSLLRWMGENTPYLDIIAYNILINGASKCWKPDIAKALFNELSTRGLKPNVRTYNVMMGCFFWEGLVREAKGLFLQMAERGCPPDSVTYNVLVQGLLKNNQHDTIEMLLQKMDEQGFYVDASTLYVLLDHVSALALRDNLLKLIGKVVPPVARKEKREHLIKRNNHGYAFF